jgi:hypothetical protein
VHQITGKASYGKGLPEMLKTQLEIMTEELMCGIEDIENHAEQMLDRFKRTGLGEKERRSDKSVHALYQLFPHTSELILKYL